MDQDRRTRGLANRHLFAVGAEPDTQPAAFDGPTPAIEAAGLGKRYGERWVLQDCTIRVPTGSVVALVGQNGAGKSTLLHLLVGLCRPSSGSVTVLGRSVWPAAADLLAQIGFVGQDKPLYRGLSVAGMLRMASRMNPGWDQRYALDRLRDRGIPLDSRISKLSGGQRTQVAMVLALAKRPRLLVLDEPLADLDPLARREVMGALMADLAEREVTVVLSSHVLSDLARVCDWLVIIDSGRVQLADSIDVLLSEHRRVIGPVELADGLTTRVPVITQQRGERQAVLLIRPGTAELMLDPRWQVAEPPLEDLVLAYLGRSQAGTA